MTKKILLIKFGGSLITDKKTYKKVKSDTVELLTRQIARYWKAGSAKMILANGGGSFSHPPSEKYSVYKGIVNDESPTGISEVQDLGAQLNRIIVRKLIDKGVPAISMNPSSFLTSRNFELYGSYLLPIKLALDAGMVPVVYGDVIFDVRRGCADISTEKIFNYLSDNMPPQYIVSKIIYCGNTAGIYDSNSRTIPKLTNRNIRKYITAIGSSEGTDVTGGMVHKVHEAFRTAQKGVDSLILDGTVEDNLFNALKGKNFKGTLITHYVNGQKSLYRKERYLSKISIARKNRVQKLTNI